MTFNWQTDEDQDEAIAGPPPAPDNPRRRRVLVLLATLVLMSLAAFFGWRRVQERAAETEAAIKADVLAVHNLARRAAEAGDDELYLSLIAAPFDAWRGAQRDLLQEDLLYGGSARLYDLLPLPGATPEPEVVLDPDLTQATVYMDHTFAFTTTARPQDTVVLRQMQTYSLGQNGWQLAPPRPDFWLPQVRLLGDRVTMEYPERDDAVARRLLAYLERLLSDTCALPGLECAPDLPLTVRFITDPAALPRAMTPEAMLESTTQIDLPSPSLAGQPLDEQGEAAVIRAYAAQTIAPLISHLAGYTCCERGLLVRAILERQLHHLGLKPWPLTLDDYEGLMEEGLTLGDALVLQRQEPGSPSPQAWRQMLSLVEFLEVTLSRGGLLATMDESLEAWLTASVDAGRFVLQWSDFVYARSRSARLAETLDLAPQGTLQLTCFESDAVAVLRYDFDQAVWRHSLTYAPPDAWQVDAVFSLTDLAGDVIKESRRDMTGARVARYVWRHDGRSAVLVETAPAAGGAHLFTLGEASALPLSALTSARFPALRASLEQDWWRVDLTVCDDDGCRTEANKVRPHWSPDGQQMLLEVRPDTREWERADLTLLRTDSRGEDGVEIGPGYAPIWLGDGHYAYLRVSESGAEDELLVAATHDDEPQRLATASELEAQLDDELPDGQRLRLDRLEPGQGNPHLILVQASLDMGSDQYLFGLSLDPDLRRPVQEASGGVLNIALLFHSATPFPYRLSPNGRWLVVTRPLSLLDLRQQSSRELGRGGAPAWSPDGDWLAQSRDNDILLRQASLGYKRPLVQDLANCTFSSLRWQ